MCREDAKIITHLLTKLLARREHSQAELMRKLEERGFDKQLSIQQLKKFVESGIQSDDRYAEAYVRSAYLKGKGPFFIQQQLRAQEVEDCVIRSNLDEQDYDWFELAKSVRQKRFGEVLPTDFKDLQKQKRFLQYRGFEQQHIEYAVTYHS